MEKLTHIMGKKLTILNLFGSDNYSETYEAKIGLKYCFITFPIKKTSWKYSISY